MEFFITYINSIALVIGWVVILILLVLALLGFFTMVEIGFKRIKRWRR